MGGATNLRSRPEFEPLIGYFLNTVVFRSQIAADLSFREFLGRVKGTVIGALAHSDIPFDAIVREVAPQRGTGRHPLFQVLFSMRPPFTDFPDGWDVTDMEVHSGASTFDLFVEFSEHPHGLAGRFVYSTDLFDRATIQRLSANFQVLLRELLANPDQAVSKARLLSDEERDTLLVDWNNTSKSFPALPLHELFEAQQEARPNHPALVFRDRQLSYAELNARSNQLAHALREKGAVSGSLVGIYLERSFEMVVALLAVLKSGAAYVPYDPDLPRIPPQHDARRFPPDVRSYATAIERKFSGIRRGKSCPGWRMGGRGPSAQLESAHRYRAEGCDLRHLHLWINGRTKGRDQYARSGSESYSLDAG